MEDDEFPKEIEDEDDFEYSDDIRDIIRNGWDG